MAIRSQEKRNKTSVYGIFLKKCSFNLFIFTGLTSIIVNDVICLKIEVSVLTNRGGFKIVSKANRWRRLGAETLLHLLFTRLHQTTPLCHHCRRKRYCFSIIKV